MPTALAAMPVLLTRIAHVQDPLYPDRSLTEITWAEEDALPFPLCLSVMGPPPACEILENISVARGNLILVDHGRRVDEDTGSRADQGNDRVVRLRRDRRRHRDRRRVVFALC